MSAALPDCQPAPDQPAGVADDTGPNVPWLDPVQARAWRAFQEMGAPLAAALNRQLMRDSGLSTADYQVLVALSEAAGGMLGYADLATSTRWEKSRLSHQLTRMQARGLVERRGCAGDARVTHVALTDQGTVAIADAAPGHVRAVRSYLIDLLGEDQLRALTEISDAVLARIAEDEACATPGIAEQDDCGQGVIGG